MEILEGSTSSAISAEKQPKPDAPNEAKEAARKFESLFLSQVVDEMIKTVDIGSFGGGDAEEKWRSFLATAVADEISLQGNTGIAQSIETAINSYKSAQNQGG